VITAVKRFGRGYGSAVGRRPWVSDGRNCGVGDDIPPIGVGYRLATGSTRCIDGGAEVRMNLSLH